MSVVQEQRRWGVYADRVLATLDTADAASGQPSPSEMSISDSVPASTLSFELAGTVALWEAMEQCWTPAVFLPALRH